MIVVIALVLVAVGSVVFHFMSPWWSTPIASNWGYIDDTIIITFWITGVVFIAVILFMAYCVFRYRYKEESRAEYKPENKKLEWWLIGLTTVGVAGMLAPGLFVWQQFVTVPENATAFEVVGQQWQWTYRFPGKDGKLGTTSPRNITADNPFGLNPKDPDGRDDVLVDDSELHIPVGKPVKVLLRSIDVLHDFYVPEFRAKMDLIPERSHFSGSPPPEPARSMSCASSYAALATISCVARSSSRKRAPSMRGSANRRRSGNRWRRIRCR